MSQHAGLTGEDVISIALKIGVSVRTQPLGVSVARRPKRAGDHAHSTIRTALESTVTEEDTHVVTPLETYNTRLVTPNSNSFLLQVPDDWAGVAWSARGIEAFPGLVPPHH